MTGKQQVSLWFLKVVREDLGNYRPVSLTPAPGALGETVLSFQAHPREAVEAMNRYLEAVLEWVRLKTEMLVGVGEVWPRKCNLSCSEWGYTSHKAAGLYFGVLPSVE